MNHGDVIPESCFLNPESISFVRSDELRFRKNMSRDRGGEIRGHGIRWLIERHIKRI
jgi:hypothetical protein